MTDLVIKVLDAGREKFRHTLQESVDFNMLSVVGVASSPNHVLKQDQLGAAVTAVAEVSTIDSTGGTPAGLAGKYFTLNSPTVAYYAWFDLDDGSTDPAVSNKTGIEINIATGDSEAQIAGKIQAVLDAHAAFSASVDTNVVTITNAVTGSVADITAGDSGLSVAVSTQGVDARVGGIATLNANGKLTASQVPAIAITDTFVVASQAAMLALSTAETGDVAVRTDESKSYILAGTDPSVLGDWQELLAPTDAVASVNGQTGTVVLDTDDIGEGSTNLYFTEGRVRSSVLTGLSAASGGTLAETDTVLEAFGKLENRVALNDAKVTYSATTARTDLIASSIVEGDTTHAPDGASVFTALAAKANDADVVKSVNGVSPTAGAVTIDTDDVGEGSTNLYFTDARAKTAAVVNTLAGSETDQAPSVSAVNAALANLSTQYKSYTNDNASQITIRQVVYVKSNGNVDLAKADAIATCGSKLGFVRDATIDAAAAGNITIATGSVIAGFSGLTPGAGVWLSPDTAGGYTQTCPSTVGHCVAYLGEALSATEVEFKALPAVEIAS